MKNSKGRSPICQDLSYKLYKVHDDLLKIEVYWEEQPCAGHKIKINDVAVEGREIKVFYEKIYPLSDEIYCQVLRKPKASYEVKVEPGAEDYIVTLIGS